MFTSKVKLRPSVLNYIAACPCWESDGRPFSPTAAKRGHDLDDAFRSLLLGKTIEDVATKAPELSTTDHSNLLWAKDFVLANSVKPIAAKRDCRFKIDCGDHAYLSGEVDAMCADTPVVFDLKSGQIRDYGCQFISYVFYRASVLKVTQGTAYALFLDHRVAIPYEYNKDQAQATLEILALASSDVYRQPKACNYCSFCKFITPNKTCGYGRHFAKQQHLLPKQ